MARNTDNNGGGTQEPGTEVPPGPQVPGSPEPATLGGPLGVRWRALGGARWGRPAFRPQKVPGGQYVTFILADNSANVCSSASPSSPPVD